MQDNAPLIDSFDTQEENDLSNYWDVYFRAVDELKNEDSLHVPSHKQVKQRLSRLLSSSTQAIYKKS